MAIVVFVVLVVFVFVLVVSAARSVKVSSAAAVVRCRLSAVVAAAFVAFSIVGWAALAFWTSGMFCASRASVFIDDRWTERKFCSRSTKTAGSCSGVDGKKCFCFAAAAGVVGSFDGILVVALELPW